MNCRELLGACARGERYIVPADPPDPQRYLRNVHIRSYALEIFRFFERLPNSRNLTIDSYGDLMSRIVTHLIPSAPGPLVNQNVDADAVPYLKTGISFHLFFSYLFNSTALSTHSTEIQAFVDAFFGILHFLNSDGRRANPPIRLNETPRKLPLTYWRALVSAAADIRPCYLVLGVNTQRTKLFERVLASATGALLLDIPTLIRWPFRPPSVEQARKTLLKGGYLSYGQSRALILECASHPAARYRGWIIPAAFHK
jgi:hypothetical protein